MITAKLLSEKLNKSEAEAQELMSLLQSANLQIIEDEKIDEIVYQLNRIVDTSNNLEGAHSIIFNAAIVIHGQKNSILGNGDRSNKNLSKGERL